jgi:hypothetical protein
VRKGIIVAAALLTIAVPVAIAATVARDDQSGGEQIRKAKLQPMGVQPLRIRGAQFEPGERVTVTVKLVLGKKMKRQVTAGTGGGFLLNFGNVNTCNGFHVGAIGSRGSRASLAFQYSSFVCSQ